MVLFLITSNKKKERNEKKIEEMKTYRTNSLLQNETSVVFRVVDVCFQNINLIISYKAI